MKRKKTFIAVAIILIFLSVALIPIPRWLKDGGTVEYNALLYSVHEVHEEANEAMKETVKKNN